MIAPPFWHRYARSRRRARLLRLALAIFALGLIALVLAYVAVALWRGLTK